MLLFMVSKLRDWYNSNKFIHQVAIPFPAQISDPSQIQGVQTGFEEYPASFYMWNGGYFLGGKAAEVLSCPLTSFYCEGYGWLDVHDTSNHTNKHSEVWY